MGISQSQTGTVSKAKLAGDTVRLWIERLESAEAGLAAHGPHWLQAECQLLEVLSDLAQTDPVARRLQADTRLRWRWDAVWAATDTDC
jgi:hypothetical protein